MYIGISTVHVDTINSQLLLSQQKVIASVDGGGGGHPLRNSMHSMDWPLVSYKFVIYKYVMYTGISTVHLETIKSTSTVATKGYRLC